GFEHLIDGSSILSGMLQRAAGLKIMLTSRQKLSIKSEWVYQVSGLPTPESRENAVHEIGNSLDLFIERARHVNPGLVLSGEELNAALQICQLVDGSPLGIELAAAWTAALGCAEIVEEIKNSYRFLTSPIQDFSERHRSLEATFNYSWQMLDDDQQKKLARLSVFYGGFNRHSAKWIADADLMKLNELLDRSLLRRLKDGRLDMHRLIHQFTDEKLKESPEAWYEVHDLHSRYFIAFLREREDDLDGEKMVVAREDIRREIENLHAAMTWAVQHWEMDAATEAVRSYFSFYMVHGWYEGAVAFDQLAALIQTKKGTAILDDPTYLSCRIHQAWFCTNLGMVEESEKISMECIQPIQEHGMDRELALCLHNLGVCAIVHGEYERARKLLEEAVALGEKEPFVAFRTFYLWLGYVEYLLGEYEGGMRSLKTSYALFDEKENSWGMSYALSKMGLAADGLGDYASAMVYLREAYQIFLDTGDIIGQGYTLSRLSMGSYFLEEYDEAVVFGEQALEIFQDINHCGGVCTSECRLGFAFLGKGLIEEANVKFHHALERAWDSQLSPLSLYALAGIACVMVLKKEKKAGWELFNYVRFHPKTPAINIDVASRWFRDKKRAYSDEKGAEDELPPLFEIVEGVLNKN
ncbi:MAG: tetratricopeptide repeat protein, partial [Chloroflexota bacterium]